MKKLISIMILSGLLLASSSYRLNLEKDVAKIKKSLPKVLNKNVELVDVSLKGNNAKYIYRLLSLDEAKVTAVKIEQFKAQAKNLANMIVCSTANIREMVDKNINIIYIYNDVNNKHLTTVRVAKENCQKIDSLLKQINN